MDQRVDTTLQSLLSLWELHVGVVWWSRWSVMSACLYDQTPAFLSLMKITQNNCFCVQSSQILLNWTKEYNMSQCLWHSEVFISRWSLYGSDDEQHDDWRRSSSALCSKSQIWSQLTSSSVLKSEVRSGCDWSSNMPTCTESSTGEPRQKYQRGLVRLWPTDCTALMANSPLAYRSQNYYLCS